MKKSISTMLAIFMLICTACTTNQMGEVSLVESEVQASSQSTGEQASISEAVTGEPGELEDGQAEQETYELLLSLYEPAVNTFFWYRSDPTEDLQIITEGEYAVDDYYRPVGKFATIEEMKAATEQFFTKDFCETIFYEPAFNQYAMYKEIDGQLYRNIQSGGMGWNYTLDRPVDTCIRAVTVGLGISAFPAYRKSPLYVV